MVEFKGVGAPERGFEFRDAGRAMMPIARSPFVARPDDGVQPRWWNATPYSGAPDPGGLLGSLQRIVGAFSNALQGWAQRFLARFNGTPFSDARFASVGDPHLSLQGSAIGSDGKATPVDLHFDSMTSHADLLSTSAFGGLRVATTVGAPGPNGVTSNARATAVMNDGNDSVAFDADGALAVTSGGQALEVAAGTSVTLAGGAKLARTSDGAVTIAEADAWGGALTTTFRAVDGRVDVTGSASNTVLGGDLIDQAAR